MINLQQLDQLAHSVGVDIWGGLTVPAECEKLNADVLKSACFERCGLNIPIYPDPDTFRAAVTLWAKKNQYTFLHIDKIMSSEYSPIENVFEDKETTRKFDGKTDTTNNTKGETSGTKDTLTGDVLSNDNTSVTHGKTTTLAHGKTTTLAHGKTTTEGGTDHNDTTNTTSAYDVDTYSPDNKTENEIRYGHTSTEGGSDTSTEGGTDTNTEGGTDTTRRSYTRTGTEDTDTTGKTKTDSTGKELKDDLEKITESRHGNIGITSANKLQIEEYNMLAQFNPYNFLAEMFERDLTLYIY